MTNKNLAFVFPGQGSQTVGMLADVDAAFGGIQDTFNEASEVLGYDLWKLAQDGPQEALNLTEQTQPLLLTAGVALWRLWLREGGEQPALMAGHSLGEWTALVCAGVVPFADAVDLVRLRGRYMQEAVAEGVGAMAAVVGLDDDKVKAACLSVTGEEIVAAVNFNSPGQVVIAGHAGAVDRAIEACKEAGARRAMKLAVSAPFHTALMQPAADRLADKILSTHFASEGIPVVHNVHARTEADSEKVKRLMIEQIYTPVLWVSCVEALREKGVTDAVECGPGKVLSGLAKRIDRELTSHALETSAAFNECLQHFKS